MQWMTNVLQNMMVYTGTPAKYIANVAAEQLEWVLMLEGLNPRLDSPMEATATLIFESSKSAEITYCLFKKN